MVFIPPEIVVFGDSGFGGCERRFNVDIPNLTWHIMPARLEAITFTWNDKISSVIVISGTWQFFGDVDYRGTHSNQVAPGAYSSVERPEINIANDSISSFRVISYDPQGDGFIWV
jgi:hypothetical protein